MPARSMQRSPSSSPAMRALTGSCAHTTTASTPSTSTAARTTARGPTTSPSETSCASTTSTSWSWPATCGSSARMCSTPTRTACVNIHPALLPSFPGASGIKDAFKHGVKVTGVTVHFATEDFDDGPIIAQEAVPIAEDDTLETLEAKIHRVEHRLYPRIAAAHRREPRAGRGQARAYPAARRARLRRVPPNTSP